MAEQVPQSKQKTERKRKKGGFFSKVRAMGVALVVLLLGIFGIRLGGGGSGDGTLPVFQENPQETAPVSTPVQAEEPTADFYTITVTEDQVFYDGAAVSLSTLRDTLLRIHQEGDIWQLHNDQAIKGTYDEAKALLVELSIPFLES